MKIIDILSVYAGGAAVYPAAHIATGIYGPLPQAVGILALAGSAISLGSVLYKVIKKPTRWIVLYTGTNEWTEMQGTREQVEAAVTDDDDHLDFGRTGYRLIPDNS